MSHAEWSTGMMRPLEFLLLIFAFPPFSFFFFFFFFFISKKDVYAKNIENKTKQKINYKGEEFRKNGRESLEVSPQIRD